MPQHRFGFLGVLLADTTCAGMVPGGINVIYSLRIIDQMSALSSIDLAISAFGYDVLYSANTTMVSSCIISRYWLDI